MDVMKVDARAVLTAFSLAALTDVRMAGESAGSRDDGLVVVMVVKRADRTVWRRDGAVA